MLRGKMVELEGIITREDAVALKAFLNGFPPTDEDSVALWDRALTRIMRKHSIPMALACLSHVFPFSIMVLKAVSCHAHDILDACLQVTESALLENINQIEIDELPVLHWAAREGNLEMIRVLLKIMHLDINLKDKNGCTALHHAAFHDRVEVVRELLKSRTFTPFPQEKISPEKKAELIPKLLINVDLTDRSQQTALHKAASEGHGEVIAELCEVKEIKVALPDINKLTPLEHALMKRSLSAVRALLSHRDINSTDKTANNVPLFHFAMKQEEKECAMEFIRHFKKLDAEHIKKGVNAIDPNDFHSSVSCAGAQGLVDIVVELIDLGANVELSQAKDVDALSKAMKQGHHRKIKSYLHDRYLDIYERKRASGGEHHSRMGGMFASVGFGGVSKDAKLAAVKFLKTVSLDNLEADISNPQHALHTDYLKHRSALTDGEVKAIFNLLSYSTIDKTNVYTLAPTGS